MNRPLESKETPLIRIVDDDPSVRDALSIYLSMNDWETAEHESGEAFLEHEDFRRPGCAIFDVRMPGISGIELHETLLRRGIRLPVIFLSAHGDISMAVEAVKRGAETFLVKPPELEKLREAIEAAVARDRQIRREAAWHAGILRQWNALTPAEQKVCSLIGKGLTNAEAAAALNVSERTVKTQKASVYGKLEIANAAEAADFLRDLQEAQAAEAAQTAERSSRP